MSNSTARKPRLSREGEGVWTPTEHARFLEALELYPHGPWKIVAGYIGTRNTRQAMTHAQKFRQKIERRRRGLRTTQAKKKSPPPTELIPLMIEHQPMMDFEQLLTTVGAMEVDWRLIEPIPLTATGTAVYMEPWLDDCLELFVESFSV